MNDDDGIVLNYEEVLVVSDYAMGRVYCHPVPQQLLHPHHTAPDQVDREDHAQQVHGGHFAHGDTELLVEILSGHHVGVRSGQTCHAGVVKYYRHYAMVCALRDHHG